jgi:hypothetical protein
MSGHIQFVTALLCEDVRDEVGEKTSLMGVHPPILGFSEFPARQPTQIVLIGNATSAGLAKLKAELSFRDDPKWGVELTMEVSGVGQGVLVPLRPTVAVFDQAGVLALHIVQNEERVLLQQWSIELDDD